MTGIYRRLPFTLPDVQANLGRISYMERRNLLSDQLDFEVEADAIAHWDFGNHPKGATNLVDDSPGVVHGPVAFSYNYVEIPRQLGYGIVTNVQQPEAFTLCMATCKANGSSNILFGSISGSATVPGDRGMGLSWGSAGNLALFIGAGDSVESPSIVLVNESAWANATWGFVACSYDNTTRRATVYTISSTSLPVRSNTTIMASHNIVSRPLAFGNYYYAISGAHTTPKHSEAILYDKILTETEIIQVYNRSKQRSLNKGIVLR